MRVKSYLLYAIVTATVPLVFCILIPTLKQIEGASQVLFNIGTVLAFAALFLKIAAKVV